MPPFASHADGERIANVFVIEHSGQILKNLTRQFEAVSFCRLAGSAMRGQTGAAQIADLRSRGEVVDVAVVDLEAPGAVEAIAQMREQVGAIIVSWIPDQDEADELKSAMDAGARLSLDRPFGAVDLFSSIRQARKLARSVPQAAADVPLARLVAVASGKGGVGVSTLAVNLAIALKERTGQRVTVLDASFQFGDLAVLCGVKKPQSSIIDLVDDQRQWQGGDVVKSLLAGPAGISVLAAAPKPEFADLVTPEKFSRVLTELRANTDVVVVDCPTWLGEATLEVMERADDILLVSDFTVSSIKNTGSLIEILLRINIQRERIHLVLNDAHTPCKQSRKEIEAFFKDIDVRTALPHDPKTALLASDEGVPFVASRELQRQPLTQAVRDLAATLSGGASAPIMGGASDEPAKGGRRWGRRRH